MYFKIPTKGIMLSKTVKDNCNSFGLVTPCGHSSYSDSDCVITVGGMYIFEHIQQTLCPDASTWTCSPLNKVCAYAGGQDASYCNVKSSSEWGNGKSNRNSLCALEL